MIRISNPRSLRATSLANPELRARLPELDSAQIQYYNPPPPPFLLLLGGSWDLVSTAICTLIGVISNYIYNPSY